MNAQDILNETQTILGDLHFPAQKQGIVQQAQQKGASSELQGVLKQLPEQEFQSIEDMLSKLPINNIENLAKDIL